ncbi:lactonase family protein [Enterococcus sp. BWB1-3]|uniref:lactonase family protein n=1 Tax=unclassified Enterococcus TaxID=2608891 RepID=UPI001921E6DF|nr:MULTISPECIES: lactonase family protein [unclassified Enterococcus]MBL1229253.1 lactonase family protein [Enterococcus sp. BWB1-3]MCB5951743.1 lactonase family protein [Enterococcus sp. BWT-B8]MCB5955774.1 lactonase family protein [Enterococcus sp. CWB-B31]
MLEKILLGTYTRRASKGIHEILLDTDKGQLLEVELAAEGNGPTYVTMSKKGNLYSVIELGEEGGAAAFEKDGEKSFKLINAVTEKGAPHCYVAVDENRQLLYGANYHRGMVYTHRILADGSLELADIVTHDEETGPHKNQNNAHVHYTDLTPDQRLVVCDLGTDRVYTYDVDDDGKLTEVAQYVAEPGTGPRHLVFHPNNQFAYLFGELDNTVTVLAYNAADGTFSQTQKLSTLPEDFTDFNGGAAIRISKDGRFLYASNRGHNSIAVFAVNESGNEVELIQLISTEGDFPRDFALNSSEEFVVAANQNTDNLTLYRRDKENGLLTVIQKDIYAPECVCVYFK